MHPEFCGSDANEFELLDLRRSEDCLRATAEIDEMYALAADVGGTGCGTPDHAQIFRNNRLLNLHCIEAARKNRVTRYLYASSTCVYPELCENITNNVPLDEEDAYPLVLFVRTRSLFPAVRDLFRGLPRKNVAALG